MVPAPSRRVLVAGAALVALAAALGWWQFDLGRLLTLESLKASRDALVLQVDRRPAAASAAFFAAYVAATSLWLPGTVVFTIAAGALFGFWPGLVLASFATSIGALVAFLVARHLLRDAAQRRFGRALAPINDGVARDGAFYLATLRLVPLVPFIVVNLAMALTPIGAGRYYVVSQLGMLPATALYVNAGLQLATIDAPSDVFSLPVLASFALLALLPLAAKAVRGRRRR